MLAYYCAVYVCIYNAIPLFPDTLVVVFIVVGVVFAVVGISLVVAGVYLKK